MSQLPSKNLENLPFRMAKMVVNCISAGQFTGQRTIGEPQGGTRFLSIRGVRVNV